MSNVSNLEEIYRYLDFYLKSFSKFKLFLTLFICLSSHLMFFLKQNAFHTLNRININNSTTFSDSHSNRENYFHNKGILAKICPLHPWKKGYKVKCWHSCLTKERKKKIKSVKQTIIFTFTSNICGYWFWQKPFQTENNYVQLPNYPLEFRCFPIWDD